MHCLLPPRHHAHATQDTDVSPTPPRHHVIIFRDYADYFRRRLRLRHFLPLMLSIFAAFDVAAAHHKITPFGVTSFYGYCRFCRLR